MPEEWSSRKGFSYEDKYKIFQMLLSITEVG